MATQFDNPVDLAPTPRSSRLLRWTIRILFMLLVSLVGRAILSQPDVAAQVQSGVAILENRLDQGAKSTSAPASAKGAPAVRAMPQNRVPVRRPGNSG